MMPKGCFLPAALLETRFDDLSCEEAARVLHLDDDMVWAGQK